MWCKLVLKRYNKSFTKSTQILSPNVIKYFINNNTTYIEVDGKHNKFISTLDESIFIEISDQIKFLYELVEMLIIKKDDDKDSPINEWFDSNGNVIVICENIKYNISKFKIEI